MVATVMPGIVVGVVVEGLLDRTVTERKVAACSTTPVCPVEAAAVGGAMAAIQVQTLLQRLAQQAGTAAAVVEEEHRVPEAEATAAAAAAEITAQPE